MDSQWESVSSESVKISYNCTHMRADSDFEKGKWQDKDRVSLALKSKRLKVKQFLRCIHQRTIFVQLTPRITLELIGYMASFLRH